LHGVENLNNAQIFPRRYFFPALNIAFIDRGSSPMRIAEDISRRVLCLPLSAEMTVDDVRRVSRILDE